MRNPPGFIADIITSPEKYELPVDLAPRSDGSPPASGARVIDSEARAQEEYEARLAAQLVLPPEQQWREVGSTLLLLLKKALSAGEKATLEAQCRAGDLQAAQLAHDASRAAATVSLQAFVDDLKKALQGQST